MDTNKTLHIISFQNPYPPVFGGVIDVYYKLKALHKCGVKVHFHCFIDNEQTDISELLRLAEVVHVYPRRFKLLKLFSPFPFSVASRYNKRLYENLQAVDAPLFFEGLQSTFVLHKHAFPTRKKILRLHNVESNYYNGLAQSETHFFKRLLFQWEARKYASYQTILAKFHKVYTLSHFEQDYVQSRHQNAEYLPVFHGNTRMPRRAEFGDFALYHGDLRMADNRKAVLFLVELFKTIPSYNLVIAAGKGEKFVRKLIKGQPNITFAHLKTQNQLATLLSSAQMNVMLSFQQSGTKLKTINALHKSRHCIVNSNMVDDPEILALCTVANTQDEFRAAIEELRYVEFTDDIQDEREVVFDRILSDDTNAQKIANFISIDS